MKIEQTTGRFLNLKLSSKEGDFSGGISELDNIKYNQSPNALNIYTSQDGILKLRPSTLLKSFQIDGDSTFNARRAYSYLAEDNTQRVVITDNIKVKMSPDLNSWITIPNVGSTGDLTLNASFETRFETYKNNLYGTNGADPIWCYDGANTTNPFGTSITPRYIKTYKDRLFFLNTPTNPYYLYFTDVGANTLPASNIIVIGKGGSYGSGLAVSKNGLVIFKTDSMFLLTGYSEETFDLIQISDRIGCVNADTIQEYNGSIIFLSADGFYKTDGVNLVKLPDYIPETLKKISQTYIWKENQFALKDEAFFRLKDTLIGYMPEDKDDNFVNEIYNFNRVYSAVYQSTLLFNGDFGTGDFTDWEANVERQNSIGTAEWTVENDGIYFARAKVLLGASQTPTTNTSYSGMRYQLVCADNEEVVDEQLITLVAGSEMPNWVLATLTVPNEYKYNYKNFYVKITTWLAYGVENAKSTLILKSKNFITSQGQGISFYFRVKKISFDGEDYHYYEFYNFWGRVNFYSLDYISGEIPIKQNSWGTIWVDGVDYNDEYGGTGYATRELQIDFYNGTSWSGWQVIDINTQNGINLSTIDPNPAGQTTKIKIRVRITDVQTKDYPYRLNSVVLYYYTTTEDVPKSNTNISSVIWDNTYLMAYTEAGDLYNKYIIALKDYGQDAAYFKWYNRKGFDCIFTYANRLYLLQSFFNLYDGTGNQGTSIYLMDDIDKLGQNADTIDNAFYETADLDFTKEGYNKFFKDISINLKSMPNFYPLKIEVYIDNKYVGDLKGWLTEGNNRYFSNKHSVLEMYNNIAYFKHLYVRLPNGYSPDSRNSWQYSETPIGWGNKIKLKIIFGYSSNESIAFLPSYDIIKIESLEINAEIHEQNFFNYNLSNEVGTL